MDINKNSDIENEYVVLEGKFIFFKKERMRIELTEQQRRFMCCLLNGIHKKNDIIRTVWFSNYETISDNNYYQMLFQCRALFAQHGIPGELIKTIPRFGVMLDFQVNKGKVNWGNQLKKFFKSIEYKFALTITLFFSVVMFMGSSMQ